MKVKVSVRRPYGDITVEGESFDEIADNLKALPQWLDIVDGLVTRTESPTSRRELLKGIVEFTSDGTVVVHPREKISDKEAICIILYANEPTPLQPKDVARLLTISGRLSVGFGARLSELRNEGLIVKDAGMYRLTAAGATMVEGLISRLKG